MITITKEIELTGKELAEQFWEMDCFEQAEFFNQNKFMDVENSYQSAFQLDNFVDTLDENGRMFVKMIWDSLKGWEELNKDE